jgi:hypothetical protein
MGNKATFYASLPPIQSAIKITGNGDGARIQLDIAEVSMAGFIPVLGMRGCGLRVTIEQLSEQEVREANISSLTEFDDEIEKSAENDPGGVDSRRIDLRRDK